MTIDFEKIIPFYDVDPMRVVWHGHYVKYIEEARCAYLSVQKLTYPDMEQLGFAFPIVELKVKYIHPCIFGQRIKVKTTLEPSENFLFFKYEILDAQTGQILCKAQTKQMCVSLKTQESLFEIPAIVLERLGIK